MLRQALFHVKHGAVPRVAPGGTRRTARVRATTRLAGVLAAGVLAGVLAGAAGCELEPEVGPALHARCSDEDSDPDRDVSFARDIHEGIFAGRGNCLFCHDPGAEPPLGVNLGGLDLTSYESLRRGGVNSGSDIVVAGQPCRSVLFLKVGAGPPFGARMPASGPPFLSEEDIALLHDWIAEGAREN